MKALYIIIVALWVLGYGGYLFYSIVDDDGCKFMMRVMIFCLGTIILSFIGAYFFPQLFSNF